MKVALVVPLALVLVLSSSRDLAAQPETLLFDHIHLWVSDGPAAIAWWEEHIGGEHVDGRGERLLFGTTRIMFATREGTTPSEGGVVDHLAFSVSDIDAKVAELVAAGAELQQPVHERPELFRHAFLVDPWGVRLEIIEDPQHLGFHHIHLRSPDPGAAYAYYHEHFGGVRFNLRGRLDGILYPGNVWLLIDQGAARPSQGTVIDHFGWRAIDLDEKIEEFRANGLTIQTEPRPLTLPVGIIHFAYVVGPDEARLEFVERAPDMR